MPGTSDLKIKTEGSALDWWPERETEALTVMG